MPAWIVKAWWTPDAAFTLAPSQPWFGISAYNRKKRDAFVRKFLLLGVEVQIERRRYGGAR